MLLERCVHGRMVGSVSVVASGRRFGLSVLVVALVGCTTTRWEPVDAGASLAIKGRPVAELVDLPAEVRLVTRDGRVSTFFIHEVTETSLVGSYGESPVVTVETDAIEQVELTRVDAVKTALAGVGAAIGLAFVILIGGLAFYY